LPHHLVWWVLAFLHRDASFRPAEGIKTLARGGSISGVGPHPQDRDPLGAAEASHADIPELAVMSDEHGPFCCSGHWLHLQQRGRPHHGAWFAAAEGFDQRRAILAELQNGLPRAETVLFEDSAHMPYLEQPSDYRASVHTFLGRIDAGQRP
jgi:pimeloyl-ACP methyl ester carboxylesterase